MSVKKIRNPKSEIRKNIEIRNPKVRRTGILCSKTLSPTGNTLIRASGFGFLSDFGASVFGIQFKHLLAILVLASLLSPTSLWACAACTGKTDSPLAVGMNWGIVTLLGFVLTVLSCLVVFFVHVARRTPPDDGETNPPGLAG
jgi:hypothetical protein